MTRKVTLAAVMTAIGAIWVLLIRHDPFRSHFWLTGVCAGAFAVLAGGVLGLARRRYTDPMPHERIAALQAAKRRYPRAVVTLIIIVVWIVFIKGETFGSLQSHLWLIMLGIVASAGLIWIVPTLINRRLRNDGHDARRNDG